MLRWIVVADDFTGAAEVGAAVRRHGWRVALTRGAESEPPAEADVWVIDTDTREVSAEKAAAGVAAVGAMLRARLAGQRVRVFKKIDSVLRGHAGLESEALARDVGAARLLVAAGNPRRSRVVRGGRLLVDGVALERTLFREDPTFPARFSDVGELWRRRGATGKPVAELAREVTNETLGELADAALAPGVLPVGALDFFEACLSASIGGGAAATSAPALPAGGGALLVCGSRAGWPVRRSFFEERGWPCAVMREPAGAGVRLLGLGLESRGEPDDCARELARIAAVHVASTRPALVCLEGGATAAAVLAEMGWKSFELLGEAEPGTACLRPRGTETVVVVKPGSYAWPRSVVEAWGKA